MLRLSFRLNHSAKETYSLIASKMLVFLPIGRIISNVILHGGQKLEKIGETFDERTFIWTKARPVSDINPTFSAILDHHKFWHSRMQGFTLLVL